MTKVVVAKITRKKHTERSRVATRHVRGSNGKQFALFAVDSNDDNFDDDLTRVFELNVALARQANTAMFGSPDGLRKSSASLHKAVRKRK
jgi:hypothetical protein